MEKGGVGTKPPPKRGCFRDYIPANERVRLGMEWNIEFRPKAKHWDPLGHSAPS